MTSNTLPPPYMSFDKMISLPHLCLLKASCQKPFDALMMCEVKPEGRSGWSGMFRTCRGELWQKYLQDKKHPQQDNDREQSAWAFHPAVVLSWGYHAWARHHKQTAAEAPPPLLIASTVSTCKFLWLVLKGEASHSVNVTADIPIYNAIEDKPNLAHPHGIFVFFSIKADSMYKPED